ncbi:MAG TPA: extracellular solute-binding protein [Ruania sp.]|nr:extracellular solute-binding protein [Ruania sp.]
MNLRTTGIVAGAAVTALALAACTGSEPDEANTDPTDSLTIATTSNNQAPMEAVVDAYREETGLDINVTIADTSQYQSTLRTQLSSGTAPDVFTVWAGGGNPGAIDVLQDAGYLLDLSDQDWVSSIDPGTAETMQIDGSTYGLPSKLDAVGTIYDTATLDELGLEVPTTYTELLGYCQDVREQGKVAFALGIQTDWVTQLIPYALSATTVYGQAPDFDQQLADGSATFAGSGWADAFGKYIEMRDAGCFNDDPLGTDVTASYDLVNSGEAVGVVQVLASYPQIASTAPEGTEFGFFPLPADDTGELPIPRGIGVSFAVNASAQNQLNAVDFVDWLAGPEASEIWFEAAPGLPALTDAEVDLDPVMQSAADIIAEDRTAPMPDQGWPSAKPQSALFTGVQQLFSDQASVEDVLASMDEAFAS